MIMAVQSEPGTLYARAEHAARIIRARAKAEPRIAIVLGSGLGDFGDEFQDAIAIPYQEIPGFPTSTVAGHSGRLVIGTIDEVPVLAMQGRVHFYEGYSLEEVTFPVRAFKLLGIKTLVLTNAAGGVDVQLSPGALMLISDHLNLMGVNPLRGPNDERFGPRFPDMSEVYSRVLQEQASEISAKLKRKQLGAHTVQVKVRYSDFTTLTRQVTFEDSTTEAIAIYRFACHLLARHNLVNRPLRLLGVGVSNLVPPRQQMLLPL